MKLLEAILPELLKIKKPTQTITHHYTLDTCDHHGIPAIECSETGTNQPSEELSAITIHWLTTTSIASVKSLRTLSLNQNHIVFTIVSTNHWTRRTKTHIIEWTDPDLLQKVNQILNEHARISSLETI